MKKAVLIGAGQFGRGGIGLRLFQSGYETVFLDINEAVINDINARGEYTVTNADEGSSVTVRNISAQSSALPTAAEKIASCDILCTCVGLTAFGKIAPLVASGIAARMVRRDAASLNVLACENAIGGTTALKGYVMAQLSPEAALWAEANVGFPDCAIDSIIPPVKNSRPADVMTESYCEWDALKGGFKGELPTIYGLNIVEDLTPYIERKLFTLNGPNAVTGALGYLQGYATVQEALENGGIYDTVWGMMCEAGMMLCRRHSFTPERMQSYRESIMRRFKNPAIPDSCVRVMREPIRKLAPNDRLVAPMNYAHEYGIETPSYFKGIAAVMSYDNPEDAQSVELQNLIRSAGFRGALHRATGLPEASGAAAGIEKEYHSLNEVFRYKR